MAATFNVDFRSQRSDHIGTIDGINTSRSIFIIVFQAIVLEQLCPVVGQCASKVVVSKFCRMFVKVNTGLRISFSYAIGPSALLVDRLNHLVKRYGVFQHKLGNNVLRNVSRDRDFVFFSINSGRGLVAKESRGARVVDVLELINIPLPDRVLRQVPMSVI